MLKLFLFLLPGVLAALLSWALTPLAIRIARAVGAVDVPGPRKVHSQPIPRLGGLAVLAAIAIAVSVAWLGIFPMHGVPRKESLAMALGAIPIFLVSVWDDIRGARPLLKFLVHGLGASIAVWMGVSLGTEVHLFGAMIPIGWLGAPLSVFWLMGLTSAFNIVDGLDGLSSGLALISAASLVAVLMHARSWEPATAALILAGAILGFLPWNLHPAKVFLGDTGSALMGFGLAGLALKSGAVVTSGLAVLVPVIIMGLPLAETVISMTRRWARRAQGGAEIGVFTADNGHFHHRLLALGLTHVAAVRVLWGVGVSFAVMGLASVFLSAERTGLMLLGLIGAAWLGITRLGYDEFALLKKGTVLKLYEIPVLKKAIFVVFVDLALVCVATWGAIGLKWGDWGLAANQGIAAQIVATMTPCVVVVLWQMGLYRGLWRISSLDDVMRLCKAIGFSVFAGLVLDRFLLGGTIPLSLFVLYGILKLFLAVGLRVSYRVLAHMGNKAANEGNPVVIWGAGVGGTTALRELWSNDTLAMKPVAFLDDDEEKKGAVISGLRVEGNLQELPRLAAVQPGLALLVSSKKIGPEALRDAARLCREHGVRLLRMELSFCEILPGVMESEARFTHASPGETFRDGSPGVVMVPSAET